MQNIALFFLVAVAFGGLAWVFIYPSLSGEKHVEKRQESVARSTALPARSARNAPKSRREQIESTLKELDERNAKARSAPLSVKITQAGLSWSKRRFFITALALGVGTFFVMFMVNGDLLSALGLGFAAGGGLPFWLLKFLKKRREAKFLQAFPDAVDVIVRGIKAGLPLA